jgi:hypothetical protein
MSRQFWSDMRELASVESYQNHLARRKKEEEDKQAEIETRSQRRRVLRGRRRLEKSLENAHDEALSRVRGTKNRKKFRKELEERSRKILEKYDQENNPKNEEIKKTGSNPENGDGGSAGGDGGGLPEDYVETSVTLCQNGSAVDGSILFKTDV